LREAFNASAWMQQKPYQFLEDEVLLGVFDQILRKGDFSLGAYCKPGIVKMADIPCQPPVDRVGGRLGSATSSFEMVMTQLILLFRAIRT